MSGYSENTLLKAARLNRLLNVLSDRDLRALLGGASIVSVLAGTVENGDVEVATVGNEGVAGIDVMLGVPRALGLNVIQVAGQGVAMNAKRFLEFMRRRPQFSPLIHRYVYAFVRQMKQAGACNRLHNAEQRCARRWLMTHGRPGSDRFSLTQDYLAVMMGTRRARVNLALATFRRAGAIQYIYRNITVVDCKQLESFSCRCYDVIGRAYALVTV